MGTRLGPPYRGTLPSVPGVGRMPGVPESVGTMPKTVMIVEDKELNMKLFHDQLEAHGYATVGTRKGDEERIRAGGCEAYLSKPISVGKFIETIRRFLGTA